MPPFVDYWRRLEVHLRIAEASAVHRNVSSGRSVTVIAGLVDLFDAADSLSAVLDVAGLGAGTGLAKPQTSICRRPAPAMVSDTIVASR